MSAFSFTIISYFKLSIQIEMSSGLFLQSNQSNFKLYGIVSAQKVYCKTYSIIAV